MGAHEQLSATEACAMFARWLSMLHIRHVRVDNRKRSHTGAPHFLLPTLHAALLLKRWEGARVHPHQETWLAELQKSGWHTSIAFGFQDAAHFVIGVLAARQQARGR